MHKNYFTSCLSFVHAYCILYKSAIQAVYMVDSAPLISSFTRPKYVCLFLYINHCFHVIALSTCVHAGSQLDWFSPFGATLLSDFMAMGKLLIILSTIFSNPPSLPSFLLIFQRISG